MLGFCSTSRLALLSEEINGNERLVDWQECLVACAGEILACLLSRVILARLNQQGKPCSRGRGEEKLANEPNVHFNATAPLW
jgi:hypothetical protein